MTYQNLTYFAESEVPKSGIGAFGVDLQLFLAQLVTFVIVLLVLKKFVFPKLSQTLENRRQALEESLENAKKTEAALNNAQAKAEELIKQARVEANDFLKQADTQAQEVIAIAEAKSVKRAEQIMQTAKDQIEIERQKLKSELRQELAGLVAEASGLVLSEKLTSESDKRLIEKALKETQS